MLTDAQITIIRTVCSYQFESLEGILLEPDLEEDYMIILESHGCTRKDFDIALIKTRRHFQEIWENPETFLSLDELDLEIFKFILNYLSKEFQQNYPKALNNILNKILIHQMSLNLN